MSIKLRVCMKDEREKKSDSTVLAGEVKHEYENIFFEKKKITHNNIYQNAVQHKLPIC